MAYITKRGSSYSVRYTYQDEHGKSCDKWESFPTKEEATNRKKQIEHELAAGTFLIPSSVTVAEFLMDWLPKQCSKHKWAPKTYESNLSTIEKETNSVLSAFTPSISSKAAAAASATCAARSFDFWDTARSWERVVSFSLNRITSRKKEAAGHPRRYPCL